MEILRNDSDNKILINTESNFTPNVDWEDNIQQYEQNILKSIINPTINYETSKFTHEPYTGSMGILQDDIWFYFYFYSDVYGTGHTGGLNYEYVGLSLNENKNLTTNTSESFFRLEFYKIPSLSGGILDYNNKKLVFTKNLNIPLGEKVYYTPINDFIYVPVFHGSNYKNEENMTFYWFSDDSAISDPSLTGDTLYMTAKYYNSIDGSIYNFTKTGITINDKIIESGNTYYKVTLNRNNNTYYITGSGRYGTSTNPIKFYSTTLPNNQYVKYDICNNFGIFDIQTLNPRYQPDETPLSNGEVSLYLQNGTPPYTYKLYSGSTLINEQKISTNLYTYNQLSQNSTYFIKYNDINNCSGQTSFNITGNLCDGFTIYSTGSTRPTNISNDNGTIFVNINGGYGPYSYTVYDDYKYEKTYSDIYRPYFTFTGLTGDTLYGVQITDKYGCYVYTPTYIYLVGTCGTFDFSTIVVEEPSNRDGNNGEITYYYSGGISPYNYSWYIGDEMIGNGQTTSNYITISNLLANTTYDFYISDSQDCSIYTGITIGDIIPGCNNVYLSVSGTPKTLTTDGTETATINGGTSPYTYTWKDWLTQTVFRTTTNSSLNYDTATGLDIGTYTVTVVDDLGCTVTQTFGITDGSEYQPWAGAALLSPTIIESRNNWSEINGFLYTKNTNFPTKNMVYEQFYTPSLEIPSYPTGGYISLSALSGGTLPAIYTFEVDQNGKMTLQYPSNVVDSNIYLLQLDSTEPTTNESFDGTATATMIDAVSPYNYVWKTGTTVIQTHNNKVQNTDVLSTMTTGVKYTITVTDSSSPIRTYKDDITFPIITNYVSLSMSSTNAISPNNNGTVTVTVTHGTAPFNYVWSNGVTHNNISSTTDTINGLVGNTTYSVTVTDSNGSSATSSVTIGIDTYTPWYSNSNTFASESTACSAWNNSVTYYVKNYTIVGTNPEPNLRNSPQLYTYSTGSGYVNASFTSQGYLALKNCPASHCYGQVYEVNTNGYIISNYPIKIC